MSDSTSHTTTEYTSSPSNKSKREASSRNKRRKSPKRETSGRRFRKSKTPPSRKRSFSPSSSDCESSEDDFPIYRANWMEKSPSNSSNRSRRLYDDLKDLDDLLSDARDVIRTILQK